MQTNISSRDDCWAGYGWVNNHGSGFWGFWYGINDDVIKIDNCSAALYLQLEVSWNYDADKYGWKLCLKFEGKEGEESALNNVEDKLMTIMKSYGFERPNRIRHGKVMTIGVYKSECSTSDELKDNLLEALNKGLIPLIEEVKRM